MLLSPRWLARHALLLAAVSVFAFLGWWQLSRAEGGNARSIGYAFEWPMFAIFAVYWWARTIHLERHPPAETTHPAVLTDSPDDLAEAQVRRDAIEEEPDGELDAYNNYLAQLHAQDQRPAR